MVNLIVHPINRTRLSDPSRLLAHSTLRSCLLTLPPTWIHPSVRPPLSLPHKDYQGTRLYLVLDDRSSPSLRKPPTNDTAGGGDLTLVKPLQGSLTRSRAARRISIGHRPFASTGHILHNGITVVSIQCAGAKERQ